MTVQIEKLLRMAEQICDNLRFSEDHAAVAEKAAEHINRFWDSRMRNALLDYGESANAEFSEELRLAVAQIRR